MRGLTGFPGMCEMMDQERLLQLFQDFVEPVKQVFRMAFSFRRFRATEGVVPKRPNDPEKDQQCCT